MKRPIHAIVLFFMVCAAHAQELSQPQAEETEQDFDLPGEELSDIKSDTGLDLGDVDFVGNPAKGLFSWWPDDLVVAPVPGYSSQLGWNLTLGGGYFIEPKKADMIPPNARAHMMRATVSIMLIRPPRLSSSSTAATPVCDT